MNTPNGGESPAAERKRANHRIRNRLALYLYRFMPFALIASCFDYAVMAATHSFPPEMEKAIDAFAADSRYGLSRRSLRKDMLLSRYHYRVRYHEYFLFGFPDLNRRGRKRYIGQDELNSIYRNLDKGTLPVFRNKDNTYSAFRKYYKRDLILILDSGDAEKFMSFLAARESCIIKPAHNCGGKGVSELKKEDFPSLIAAFDSIASMMPCIVEEKIVQSAEMARFHPKSVNTVRFNTIYKDGHPIRFQAVLRIGRGCSIVDNASSGGLFAPIDIQSGIIRDCARSETGEEFCFHPDTGVKIIGEPIPRWQELCRMADELAGIVPEQKQVGWDLALTDKSWVLVEANCHPVIQIFEYNRGMRSEIENLLLT